MTKKIIKFSNTSTVFYFNSSFDHLEKFTPKENAIIITDENIFNHHQKKFKGWKTIVIKSGEQNKIQLTVDSIIEQLIAANADRKTFLIGVGGGVVTDITGYVAGIFLRGINFGFVPTSILAMVDAAIGGKNGIDVGVCKNMVGLIRQPKFLLYDYSFLKSLPDEEWVNGFAEMIKHACIKDVAMFKLLEQHELKDFQEDFLLLNKLVQRNAMLKSKIVQEDEFENGDRKLLNFGHTFGHAIENSYQLSHGKSVAIGMAAAARLSAQLASFKEKHRLIALIKKYQLPTSFNFNSEKIFEVMLADKKRIKNVINFVLLEKIGKAIIKDLSLNEIKQLLN
ncbi:MAG: 3-dehydroquinate synthase [Chitinophagaceae bacterium]